MSQLVHQLGPADHARIAQHFLQLNDDDRRLRFGSVLDDAGIRSYCGKLDFDAGAVFGVYGNDLQLDGVAHLALWHGAGEVGLSVLTGARGAGIGGLLFDRAALHARNMGIAELFMHSLRENEAIRHIARRAGMRIVTEAGEADAYLELSKPTSLTIGQELYEQQCALIDWTLMNQLAQAQGLVAGVGGAVSVLAPRLPAPPSSTSRAAGSSRNTRVCL